MSTTSHGGRISPSEVSNATFYVVESGYDTGAVQHFLQAVSAQMEADRAQIEAQKVNTKDEMVKIISQAQVLAEKFVAEAEEYSKDLVASARTQYSEILRRAEESAAKRSGSQALATTAAAPANTTPIDEIEYVRTYTKVAQVQLRAVIDALAEQVDRLGDTPASPPR
ncbi:DivIVA domain-containing protein [Arthrobacter sp. ok362]|jgi:cell division initiation protein|uniref:DivIVA domain-containing protein n=1 Tax=Arthrobacter sp. ok362 TaxID=1761745 RepID=UPI000885CCAF|nr:DivIVA domain-containing protein [Arthrobacter sp. ok362]SDL35559.1 cell division initiation protein [Arthrobacter sp. ok362]